MDEIICFCHTHTAGDIKNDVRLHGRSTIMESIIKASKDGRCNCRENNPRKR